MSSHSESIQFLATAQSIAGELAQMQQGIRSRLSDLSAILAQATGNTTLGAQMDQMQAQLGEHCDTVTRALVGLAEMLGTVIAQMQALG